MGGGGASFVLLFVFVGWLVWLVTCFYGKNHTVGLTVCSVKGKTGLDLRVVLLLLLLSFFLSFFHSFFLSSSSAVYLVLSYHLELMKNLTPS